MSQGAKPGEGGELPGYKVKQIFINYTSSIVYNNGRVVKAI